MRRLEALRADAGILRQMLRGMPKQGDHAERLAGFYATQAADYDRFRERLLPGRAELIASLQLPPGARVIELGGGTGRNLEFFAANRRADLEFELVDLCAPLLDIARQRTRGWPQVRITQADATTYRPQAPVDCVLIAYALSMIPDWRAAVSNALAMLKPGGQLAVVDFYVGADRPGTGLAQHGAITRHFWPRWFAHDGVRLGPETPQHLLQLMPSHQLWEARASLPYLPLLRVPYFRFVGRKGD
jgi:ubiquinone/menaquinone biosynthesis C-methylase UbiE